MLGNYQRNLTTLFKRSSLKHAPTENAVTFLQGKARLTRETQTEDKEITFPLEFNGKDYTAFLLHIDAEIEHGLMLQYLYAAYSLGGEKIPKKFHERVRTCQDIILGIAKEEMGHFVTVQNVLKLIGAPLHFGRQDYPWDTPFYPFPFKLEPVSLVSLAKYIFAEAPEGWIDTNDPFAKEIKKRIKLENSSATPVGILFDELIDCIKDPLVIGDEHFNSKTYSSQAKFDEWGRGYKSGRRGNTSNNQFKQSPDILIAPLSSRDDAINALSQIAEQGEATTLDPNQNTSHFERFIFVYKEVKDLLSKKCNPAREVAVNPYIAFESDEKKSQDKDLKADKISHPEAKLWGHLFNLRYRMLLNYLAHSFSLGDETIKLDSQSPRGLIINSSFGEMYNLRSISTVIVQLPLNEKGKKKSGPPFSLPYTLTLPVKEYDKWRLHLDLLEASEIIINELLKKTQNENKKYLHSLNESDKMFSEIIKKLLR